MKLPDFEKRGARETRFTTCYMCACRCGVKVTLEDGRIRFVQGNPNHPVNRGVLCGKGNAAIMKQCSPAKLRAPMMRKPGTLRGEGEFVPISWDKATEMLTNRLAAIRQSDPDKLAFFTGRDQMQALTGLWAAQFGTLNWAAHGGFCSVNMAAAGLLTTGFSFWEFGEPDWDLARYFMLWGVAEDHSSNPLKIGMKKLKERGAKIVAINPVRTGYQAIADEWLPVRPGTDGILAMAMAQVLLRHRRMDEDFLACYTNMPWLVIDNPGAADDGLFARDKDGNAQVWDMTKNTAVNAADADAAPALFGEFTLAGNVQVKTAMTLFVARAMERQYTPQNAARICGINAKTIERIALEMASAAFDNPPKIAAQWTDCFGRRRDSFVGRAVAMHAMRGISAHSNGFQTCRAIHFLQALLGAVDSPGSHLAKPPYPKHPPAVPPPAKQSAPGKPLTAMPLGMPSSPEDLVVDESGAPLRIDKAFSWDAPFSAHGLMHNVLANAAKGDPYKIDTLMIFMANLAWNSSMDTAAAVRHLTAMAKDGKEGEYAIPFVVVCDAFHSETVNYADLVLPDTTFLERRDVISMLDRPISEAHAACDAIRAPVVPREFDTRPWQEVLVELGGRLQLPAFTDASGGRKYKDYEHFITHWQKTPGTGFLAGWRGKDGGDSLVGEPNARQWQKYEENECFFRRELPQNTRYLRFANRDYLRYAKKAGWTTSEEAIVLQLYCEPLQKFRLAGEGHGKHLPPTKKQGERLREHCDPLPFWSPPLAHLQMKEGDGGSMPNRDGLFYAITQRPMFMYHSWDSQNAWLRQIADRNPVFINAARAADEGLQDGDWVWLISPLGKAAAAVKTMDGVRADTIWTWNAIAKNTGGANKNGNGKKTGAGAWGLAENASEGVEGFLMNHLIPETLTANGEEVNNSDPITGQAAWYDLRVSITKMTEAEIAAHLQKANTQTPKDPAQNPALLRYITHKPIHLTRPLRDVLTRK
ncbi:MAG: molybdopterin-dependent oxidoreductase [Gammaproteobacteria bacterium]